MACLTLLPTSRRRQMGVEQESIYEVNLVLCWPHVFQFEKNIVCTICVSFQVYDSHGLVVIDVDHNLVEYHAVDCHCEV